MSIECYCEPAEGEPCDVWIDTWHKARKPHRCVECKETINPGERYRRTFSVFDGRADHHSTCEFCANEWDRVYGNGIAETVVPGELACVLVCELRDNETTQEITA